MPVRFVAVVDARNIPVYFRSAEGTAEDVAVNHQFIAEMSLDFIEQQAARIEANVGTPVLALVHDGIAVYATVSNTRTKYLTGIDPLREPRNLGAVMAALRDAYVGYMCNPFRSETATMIESPQFEKKIDQIFHSTDSSAHPQEGANTATRTPTRSAVVTGS